jgi:hypothetical protein
MNSKANKFSAELKSFENIWEGGYFEGDPLNPFGVSNYGAFSFMSILHATYLRCIKPYLNDHTVALEIGPGRGAWTKTLLNSKEVYVLDALSEEHNKFFEYLGNPKNVKYIKVQDFKCKVLPVDHFNFMFSFGCLCHISFAGITEYAINLYPKLKHGCNCFWMIADYDKYNKAVLDQGRWSIYDAIVPSRRRNIPLKWLLKSFSGIQKLELLSKEEGEEPTPGRWYHAGIDKTCSMLRKAGYKIIDPDVGTIPRDPIIHFLKD